MGIKYQQGFTIIETMLVLAVSGLLVIGILIGSGVAIGQQRYRDSVNSLQALLQQQYSETQNVINSRTTDDTCSLTGDTEPRGRSMCIIVGRYIEINPANDAGATVSRMTLSNVLAYQAVAPSTAPINTIDDILGYELVRSTVEQETKDVAWGANIVAKNTSGPAIPLRILIIQAPSTGSILTFVSDPLPSGQTLKDIVTDTNARKVTDLCLDPAGLQIMGNRVAVRIGAYASGASAIEVPTEAEAVCG